MSNKYKKERMLSLSIKRDRQNRYMTDVATDEYIYTFISWLNNFAMHIFHWGYEAFPLFLKAKSFLFCNTFWKLGTKRKGKIIHKHH